MTDTPVPMTVVTLTQLTRATRQHVQAAELGTPQLIVRHGVQVAWLRPADPKTSHDAEVPMTTLMRDVRATVMRASIGEVLLVTRRSGVRAGQGPRPGVALLMPVRARR